MKASVELERQVLDFTGSLPPGPRRDFQRALPQLEKGKGDVRPLRVGLEGFFRVRVMSYRVVFFRPEPLVIRCAFAERRSVVYEMYANLLAGE